MMHGQKHIKFNISVATNWCAVVLSVQSIGFPHTTSATSYCPISDRYLPAHPIYQDKIIYFLWIFSHRYGRKTSCVCLFYMNVCARDFRCVRIIATIHKLRHVCLSVHLSSGNKSAPTVRIFINFGVRDFFEWKIKVPLQSHTLTVLFMKPPVN